jgi:thiosulfate/3-mercaptopyruvate sulfurtransferase
MQREADMTDSGGLLVEPRELAQEQGSPDLVVLDCSWHLPESGRNGEQEFRVGHIPHARFFDLDKASDSASRYANMLPAAAQFADYVGSLGIGNRTKIVLYDSSYVSARVWWMFRYFGHDAVRILDGGWRRWKAEGRPIEEGTAAIPGLVEFTAVPRGGMVADWRNVLQNIDSNAAELVDARTAERFTGAMPSGYPGVPGGHIPGAKNLPWNKLIEQARSFRFAEPETARRLFGELGVDLTKPIITTCGSGVTAAIIGLTLERLGKRDWVLYDGSWHEWAQLPDVPKVVG